MGKTPSTPPVLQDRNRFGGPLQLTAHYFDVLAFVSPPYPNQHRAALTLADWNWGIPGPDTAGFPQDSGPFGLAAQIWNFRDRVPFVVGHLDIAIVGRDDPMPYEAQTIRPGGPSGDVWAAYREIERTEWGASDLHRHRDVDVKAWAARDSATKPER